MFPLFHWAATIETCVFHLFQTTRLRHCRLMLGDDLEWIDRNAPGKEPAAPQWPDARFPA
jgi:hypothetical protein